MDEEKHQQLYNGGSSVAKEILYEVRMYMKEPDMDMDMRGKNVANKSSVAGVQSDESSAEHFAVVARPLRSCGFCFMKINTS